jgi:hypothetical protein
MAKVSLYDHSRDRTIELENSSTITVGRGFFEVISLSAGFTSRQQTSFSCDFSATTREYRETTVS